MDKQTLSNYGWLVIVTLVLAIMLALATPFGTYVGDGVVAVANGLTRTNEDATAEENITQESVEWNIKTDHGIEYNTYKYYNSLEDAMNDVNSNNYNKGSNKLKSNSVVVSAPNGKTPVVRLLKNITINETLNLYKDIILDLYNHTLHSEDNVDVFKAQADVNFKIDGQNTGKITANGYSDIFDFSNTNSNVVVNNIEIIADTNGPLQRVFRMSGLSNVKSLQVENFKADIKSYNNFAFANITNTNAEFKNIEINHTGRWNNNLFLLFGNSKTSIENAVLNINFETYEFEDTTITGHFKLFTTEQERENNYLTVSNMNATVSVSNKILCDNEHHCLIINNENDNNKFVFNKCDFIVYKDKNFNNVYFSNIPNDTDVITKNCHYNIVEK